MNDKRILDECLVLMNEMKAEDIVTIDLKKKTAIADYFIIVTAKNDLHSKAIFNALIKIIKNRKRKTFYTSMSDSSKSWRILDYNTLIIHIFLQEDREKYDLESLWTREIKDSLL